MAPGGRWEKEMGAEVSNAQEVIKNEDKLNAVVLANEFRFAQTKRDHTLPPPDEHVLHARHERIGRTPKR